MAVLVGGRQRTTTGSSDGMRRLEAALRTREERPRTSVSAEKRRLRRNARSRCRLRVWPCRRWEAALAQAKERRQQAREKRPAPPKEGGARDKALRGMQPLQTNDDVAQSKDRNKTPPWKTGRGRERSREREGPFRRC